MNLIQKSLIAAALLGAITLTGCHGGTPAAAQHAGRTDAVSSSAASNEVHQHVDKVMLIHVDQQPEQTYPWGAIHWLMSDKIDPAAQQTFGVVRIDAGKKNALHMHPNCEELLYVLSGSGETLVGDKTVPLKPGDLVRIPAGTVHQATVTSKEPMVAVISYSSPDRQVVNYGTGKE